MRATGSPSWPPSPATGSPPGFAGTPFITDALTQTGHLDDAYRLLLEKECPSWLYPVTMGATTVWERWDSMLPDGTINPGEMTSSTTTRSAPWPTGCTGSSAASRRSTPGYCDGADRAAARWRPHRGARPRSTDPARPHRRAVDAVGRTSSPSTPTIPEGVTGVLRLPGQDDRPLDSRLACRRQSPP